MKVARIPLFAGVCLAAITMGPVGFAQTEGNSQQAAPEGLEDIVVTARRVEENAQKIPVSVGSVSPAELQARQIFSLTDIKGAVANMTVAKTAVAGGNFITIRGITGSAIPNVSVDSSVGIYIDGVYLGRSQSSGGDIADIERVEVLRGPQGTLFGRNSSAGAVNFITRGPSGRFGVEANVQYGNYDRRHAHVSIDTPEFNGLSARFTYQHDEIEGDVRNRAAGTAYRLLSPEGSTRAASRMGGHNGESIVAKLRYTGIDNLTVEYKFDHTDRRETPPGPQIQGFGPGPLAALVTQPDVFLPGVSLYDAQLPGAVPVSFGRLGSLNLDQQGESTVKSTGHQLNLTLDLSDNTTFKSISAYRKVKTRSESDLDGGFWTIPVSATERIPFCVSCSVNTQDQQQFTQEFQLISNGPRLKYIAGLYYFHERGLSDLVYSNFKALPNPNAIPVGAADFFAGQRETAYNTSYAAYFHADYKITDPLVLAVGARYTADDRIGIDRRDPLPAGLQRRAVANFQRFNYDVALTYSFNDDVSIYAKYATGYQSGGIVRGNRFKPEDAESYEAGIKSELFNRRVRLNAAVFHTVVTDQQQATSSQEFGLFVVNVGKAKITGFEAEAAVVPVRGLTLTGNVGYAPPKYSDGGRNRAPKINASFSAQYDAPSFDNGMYLSARIDGDYRGTYYGVGTLYDSDRVAQGNLPASIWGAYPSEQAYLDAAFKANESGDYTLVNGRLSMMDIPVGDSKLRVSGYVRNIFNSRGQTYSLLGGTFLVGTFERPRTYGLELAAKF